MPNDPKNKMHVFLVISTAAGNISVTHVGVYDSEQAAKSAAKSVAVPEGNPNFAAYAVIMKAA